MYGRSAMCMTKIKCELVEKLVCSTRLNTAYELSFLFFLILHRSVCRASELLKDNKEQSPQNVGPS